MIIINIHFDEFFVILFTSRVICQEMISQDFPIKIWVSSNEVEIPFSGLIS